MTAPWINEELINDRAKLIMHRLTARELRRRPELRDRAREVVRDWAAITPEAFFVRKWAEILDQDLVVISRRLTERSGEMTELRLSSPFSRLSEFTIHDVDLRRRIWRIAKRAAADSRLERSKMSSAP